MIENKYNRFCTFVRPFASVLTALAVVGCAAPTGILQGSNIQDPALGSKSFSRFPDIPMPANAKLNLDKTLVFGGGEDWFGRLTLTTTFNPNQMFDFYGREMTKFGWEAITSIRSSVSVMTYSRDDRIATIQIQSSTLSGTQSILTVSPRGKPEQAPAASGAAIPPAPTRR